MILVMALSLGMVLRSGSSAVVMQRQCNNRRANWNWNWMVF